jgi:proteasome lid subunit RPN8/RPN11
MKCKVRVSKNALDYFRSKARNNHKEEQAYLSGRIVSPELVVVEGIHYTKKYAVQTANEVRWWMEDYERVKKNAEERGLRIVGDLHSHPNYFGVMSPTDYKSHIEEGYRVCGICSTNGRKTKVYFWIAESALPCEIFYA